MRKNLSDNLPHPRGVMNVTRFGCHENIFDSLRAPTLIIVSSPLYNWFRNGIVGDEYVYDVNGYLGAF